MAKPNDPQFPWYVGNARTRVTEANWDNPEWHRVSEYDHDSYQTRHEQNAALGAIFSVLEQIRDELRELNTTTQRLARRS